MREELVAVFADPDAASRALAGAARRSGVTTARVASPAPFPAVHQTGPSRARGGRSAGSRSSAGSPASAARWRSRSPPRRSMDLIVGGKPIVSWTAFGVVMFELTMLFAGLANFTALVLLSAFTRRHGRAARAAPRSRASGIVVVVPLDGLQPRIARRRSGASLVRCGGGAVVKARAGSSPCWRCLLRRLQRRVARQHGAAARVQPLDEARPAPAGSIPLGGVETLDDREDDEDLHEPLSRSTTPPPHAAPRCSRSTASPVTAPRAAATGRSRPSSRPAPNLRHISICARTDGFLYGTLTAGGRAMPTMREGTTSQRSLGPRRLRAHAAARGLHRDSSRPGPRRRRR